jgi:general stress protein YciG
MTTDQERKPTRGLASASEQTREEVARMGGEAVSRDRNHMAEIGRKGGERSGENRRNQQ